MILSIITSYLIYTLLTAFTPGPNNIVALYAVSQNGWRLKYVGAAYIVYLTVHVV